MSLAGFVDCGLVPTFCRHNRILENCPICSKKSPVVSSTAVRSASPPRREPRPAGAPPRAPRRSATGGMTVRHVSRAPDDGYSHDLVPGLRSSVDAGRLADELAFSAARLRELAEAPPGLYAEVAAAPDREEAAWLLFQIAFFSPLEGARDPWAGIRVARTTWVSGQAPDLSSAEFGPRTAYDPRRGDTAFTAYRAWAQRGGGQIAGLAGEESWTPQQRYDRAFERLSLPGFGRPHRLELLLTASALGLVGHLDVWTLKLNAAAATDPVILGAKRVLGIGDAVLLARRVRELAHAVGVPVACTDLALHNWAAPTPQERVTAGATVPADAGERAAIAQALGVG